MAKNQLIEVWCFGQEIGRLGMDENQRQSYFQYHPDFLKKDQFRQLFPQTGIIKRVTSVQVFKQYFNETFRGLPPMIADSLPDMFGNIIFKTWLEANEQSFRQISVLEQLAYVANRGMGALEYRPSKEILGDTSIDLAEILTVLKEVLSSKKTVQYQNLNHQTLLNIFKIGTSAGGARPKILLSEHKKTGAIIAGDLLVSEDYHHYLVKLSIEEELDYPREVIEYAYYLTATKLGIRMMPSKLIDDLHFSTLRFDRQQGEKQHILTASGLTGWDFKTAEHASYENLFELALFLKIPHRSIEELFRRMVFNVVFCNMDDHLKNHSFIYDATTDRWDLSPAYDLTYSLNPLLQYKRTSRALSINGKRVDLKQADLLTIADTFTIKNAKNVLAEVQEAIGFWKRTTLELDVSLKVVDSMERQFLRFGNV